MIDFLIRNLVNFCYDAGNGLRALMLKSRAVKYAVLALAAVLFCYMGYEAFTAGE